MSHEYYEYIFVADALAARAADNGAGFALMHDEAANIGPSEVATPPPPRIFG